MISRPGILLDDRDAAQILKALLARRLGYVPEWEPQGAGLALAEIFAHYLQTIIQRLNQAPDKNKLVFLDLLGLQLIPARAARTPIIFRLAENAPDGRLPAGTRIAAPPPPEQTDQIIFETERSIGLMTARLKEVVSLWPGRDQYIDHSAAFIAGQPLQPFKKRQLENTPHILYLAHDTLLALAGKSSLDVNFELTTISSEHLGIVWQYWDGEVWREFLAMRPACDEEEAHKLDSTDGLQSSGRFRLQADCAETKKTTVNGVEAFWIRGQLAEPLPLDPEQILPEVESIQIGAEIVSAPLIEENTDKVIKTGGLILDKAFSDATAIDVTKPFFPLGLQPQPGSVFYFTNAEVFSKPGARVQLYIEKTVTPSDQLNQLNGTNDPSNRLRSAATLNKSPLLHKVSWEYWNGRKWEDLVLPDSNNPSDFSAPSKPPQDFSDSGFIDLIIPTDMAPTTINEEEGLWMRVRLLSGGYGIKSSISTGDPPTEFPFIITQPPALSNFLLSYTWQYGPFHPEYVVTYNNFQYEDHTEEAKWPGQTFQPFKPVPDVTPSFYLGFDKKPPVDRLGIFFDVLEQPAETEGPALIWEYWDDVAWQALSVEDETQNLRVPGLVSFIGPRGSQPLARFAAPLHWLRARLKEDGPPGEPVIEGIYLNAVWATQQQTIVDEPMGASTGQPHQVFSFRQIPVLAGQQIEVRELAGARANVEWRLIAREILDGEERAIGEVESMLAAEGAQADIEKNNLRLRRDRRKQVTEVWVRWQEQQHLLFSEPGDRHYVVDRGQGQLLFGDGTHGKIPPPGAAILARQYRSGGGRKGNLPAQTIKQLVGPIGGVEEAFNPRPSEGGADRESLENFAVRGPQTLRHRGRSIRLKDYETLAYEASAAVAFARAIPTHNPSGRSIPGWVTLLIIPQSQEPRPWPSFGLRERVQNYIEARAPADLAAAHQIHVTGPDYLPIEVMATIAPIDPAEAGAVEQRARESLEDFLHPLRGGPERGGWALGRDVFVSDVAAVMERIPGIDYVEELGLLLKGALQGERIRVAEDRIVVAGEIQLKLKAGER